MGRVSTCQKNCNTIDLRGAQVNENYSLHLIFKFYINRERSALELFPVVELQ